MTDHIDVPLYSLMGEVSGMRTNVARITPEIARQIVAMVVPAEINRLCAETDFARVEQRVAALEADKEKAAEIAAEDRSCGLDQHQSVPVDEQGDEALDRSPGEESCDYQERLRAEIERLKGELSDSADRAMDRAMKYDARVNELIAARADADKYKGELNRHVRMLSECANERNAARAEVDKLRGLLRDICSTSTMGRNNGQYEMMAFVDAALLSRIHAVLASNPTDQLAGASPAQLRPVVGRQSEDA